jgi:transposase
MDTRTIFSNALGIAAPWFISDVEFDGTKKRLDIRLDFTKGSTFFFKDDTLCGDYKAYDTVEKEWRHLNFFEHECYLRARVPRVKTEDGKIHLIMPPWAGVLNGFTLLFEALLMQLAKSMPVHNVAQLTKVSDYQIWAMLDKYTEKARVYENYEAVTHLGMDETSLAKGHDYASLFVDLNKKRGC